MKKEIIYLALALLTFIALKFMYSHLDVEDVRFLLTPTNWGVSMLGGSSASFDAAHGYYHPQLNMVIDKSCSGYTFWLICFLMTVFVAIRSPKIPKPLAIPMSLLLAYIVTIVANVSRITGYLMLTRNGIATHLDAENKWLHEAEGIFVYLSFLIAFYLLFNHLTNKTAE